MTNPRSIRFGVYFSWLIAGTLTIFLALVLRNRGYPSKAMICTILPVLLLLGAFLQGGFCQDLPPAIARFGENKSMPVLGIGLSLLYSVYGYGTETFTLINLAMATSYFMAPIGFWWLSNQSQRPLINQTCFFLAIISLWLPIDLGWIRPIWTWPEGHGSAVLGNLSASVLCFYLFQFGFRQKGIGFDFRLCKKDLFIIFKYQLINLAIVIPFGFVTDFLKWQPETFRLTTFAATLAGGFIIVALPEELLFRGVITNRLVSLFGNTKGLVLGSILFGLSHINNQAFANGPVPDIRLVVFAGISGLFYGLIWLRTRTLLSSALAHASLNALWYSFLRPS